VKPTGGTMLIANDIKKHDRRTKLVCRDRTNRFLGYFLLLITCSCANSSFADFNSNAANKKNQTYMCKSNICADNPPIKIPYTSAFDSYIKFDFLPEIGWREANDKVGQIGGWRAYAKIVQENAQRKSPLIETK